VMLQMSIVHFEFIRKLAKDDSEQDLVSKAKVCACSFHNSPTFFNTMFPSPTTDECLWRLVVTQALPDLKSHPEAARAKARAGPPAFQDSTSFLFAVTLRFTWTVHEISEMLNASLRIPDTRLARTPL
jgi:hypothetical protein